MVEAAAALSALLDRNVGPDQGNAFRAAARNDVSLLRLILDVQPSLLRATDEDGWTLLYAAAKDGGADAVRFLHARGVALDEPDSDGATPMWVAAAYGGAHLVRLLGDLGADARRADHNGTTPAHVAAWKGNLESVRALHALGALMDEQQGGGETPLFMASLDGDNFLPVIAFLHEECGARLDTPDGGGMTAADVAADEGFAELAAYLEQHSVPRAVPAAEDAAGGDSAGDGDGDGDGAGGAPPRADWVLLHSSRGAHLAATSELPSALSASSALAGGGSSSSDDEEWSCYETLAEGLTALAAGEKNVEIGGVEIGNEGVAKVADELRGNATCKGLSLYNCVVCDPGAVRLAKALRENTTLTTLSFARSSMAGVEVPALAYAHEGNRVGNAWLPDPAILHVNGSPSPTFLAAERSALDVVQQNKENFAAAEARAAAARESHHLKCKA